MKNYKNFIKTKDGQFACTGCDGEGNIGFYDDDPITCSDCDGTGYLCSELFNKIKILYNQIDNITFELNDLYQWIKNTSNCKKCGGDPNKTLGGTPCEECTLVGTMPWGG